MSPQRTKFTPGDNFTPRANFTKAPPWGPISPRGKISPRGQCHPWGHNSPPRAKLKTGLCIGWSSMWFLNRLGLFDVFNQVESRTIWFPVVAWTMASVGPKRGPELFLLESRVARWFIFVPKIPIWVYFIGSWNWNYIIFLWPFGIFYCHFV
jgi:hypothetical protein